MGNNDFYSMDKLVEFGMGMAVADQMAQSMNRTLNEMNIPGSGKAPSQKTEDVYYIVFEGKQAGPFSKSEMSRLIEDKKIDKKTYVWKPGMKNWDLAENISEVLALVALTPPPLPE